MGIFSFLKTSVNKSFEVKKIAKILGDVRLPTVDEMLSNSRVEERKLAEEKLYDLVESNKDLKSIMLKHGANREHLRDLYHFLVLDGAGQWIKDEFVVVSSLAFQATLDYALYNYQKMKESYDDRLRVCFRLIQYFQGGEVKQISPDE